MPRPKGSKNRVKAEFDAKMDRLCRLAGIDPVDFLVKIMAGTEDSESWARGDRLTAAVKLFEKRYPNKRTADDDVNHTGIPEQIVITYDDSQRGKPVLSPVAAVGTAR